jgi:UDP-2,3-diacylglucosamine hydrolase
MLHPDWASRLALGSSTASRVHRARDEGRGLRAYAERELARAKNLDLLVYGHSHVAALERMSSGGVFANAGSWLDAPTYLKLTAKSVDLVEWDGSPEGKRLNSIDLRA